LPARRLIAKWIAMVITMMIAMVIPAAKGYIL
jgi:hypothetical protein